MPPRKPEPVDEPVVEIAPPPTTSAPPATAYRTTRVAWWCPRCDNSQSLDQPACVKCGWTR